MERLEIIKVTDEKLAPLYHKYVGRTVEQPAYIEISLGTGLLFADWSNSDITTDAERYGHDRYYGIPARITARQINGLMVELYPLFQQMLDGYSTEFVGSHQIAVLSPDAQQAEQQIIRYIDQWDPILLPVLEDWSEWLDESFPALLQAVVQAESQTYFNARLAVDVREQGYIDATEQLASSWVVNHIQAKVLSDKNFEQWYIGMPGWVIRRVITD